MTKGSHPDLFDFPRKEKTGHELSRNTDPHTSREAGELVIHKLTKLRRMVYDRIVLAGSHGLTDYEIEEQLKNHGSTYRTRRSELVDMGLVMDTGTTRIIRGRARKVWRAK